MARFDRTGHWRRTRRHAIIVVGLWMAIGLVFPILAPAWQGRGPGAASSGYLAAVGLVLIGFVALTVWFATRQQALDRDCAVADED